MAALLTFAPADSLTIQSHAERCYPEECCGLLLGLRVWGPDGSVHWQVKAIQETQNCWGDIEEFPKTDPREGKHNRFAIDPQVLLTVQKADRQREIQLIGIYHSHPQGRPVPSEFDRAIAWPEYVYWIVSLESGQVNDGKGWILDDQGQFQEILSTLLV
ncbi:MAG: M67 family metallopeptidase [Synechocystis sp.]